MTPEPDAAARRLREQTRLRAVRAAGDPEAAGRMAALLARVRLRLIREAARAAGEAEEP
jgi:hypothetical protein